MILALLLAAAPAFQDTAALDRAVSSFTGRPVGNEGGARTPIDPRLKLASCPTVALSWRTPAQDAVVVARRLSGGGELANFLVYPVGYVRYLTGLEVDSPNTWAGVRFMVASLDP